MRFSECSSVLGMMSQEVGKKAIWIFTRFKRSIAARRHHPSVNYSTPQMNHYLKQFYLTALRRLLRENETVPYRQPQISLTQSHINMQINFL